jgi:hypothetical protein
VAAHVPRKTVLVDFRSGKPADLGGFFENEIIVVAEFPQAPRGAEPRRPGSKN